MKEGRDNSPLFCMGRGKNTPVHDEIIGIDPYRKLANAIIIQAAVDYRTGYINESALSKFLSSQWYTLLTNVDGEYLLRCLKKEKDNDSKGIEG